MFEEEFVQFTASAGSVNLVGASVLVDASDFPGVQRACHDLAQDFGRVTSGTISPVIEVGSEYDSLGLKTDTAIIVGSLSSSRILQLLEKSGKLNVNSIRGKWESFTTAVIDNPLTSCKRALVIAGSDKRGAIFGVYTLSEQIGVSPYACAPSLCD